MTRVSVIIPTYNRAHLLPESVGSVLSQDYGNIEVVVVDDGSTDNTEQVVRSLDGRVKYVRQANSGASVARNLGILRSTGDYLMFLDSDDLLLPGAISKLARALDEGEEFGAAYCGFVETRNGEVVRRSPLDHPSGMVLGLLLSEYACIVHSVMVRRNCLAVSGLFDPALRMYEDMDFNARVASEYSFVFVPEHLVEYRLAESGASKTRERLAEQGEAYLRKIAVYRNRGLLSRDQWGMARDRVYGPPPGRKALWEAYSSYEAGRCGEALRGALLAIVLDPRYLLSRTWISFAGKTLLRSLGVPMGRRA